MAHVLEASPENIRRAAEVLQAGGLVAFPTETVYGLGATITNEKGLVRIFTAKGRPDFIPLIVHLADVSFLPTVVAEVPAVAWRLIETFWPGPLTLVLPKKQELSDLVTAGLPTVGVRLPQNEVALGLIWEVGVPLVAPSANRFGHPSPTRAEHVQEDLGDRIDLILDGGETQLGVESTLVDLCCSPPRILRPGGVSQESLQEIVGEICVTDSTRQNQHYVTKAKVLLYEGRSWERVAQAMRQKAEELQGRGRVGLLLPEGFPRFASKEAVEVSLGSFVELEKVARSIFPALRALEREGVAYILTVAPPRQGIGLAIFDRLFKAAANKIIEVN